MAYRDLETANTGGAYRTDEGVDISAHNQEGFYVTNIILGEWLEYTINIEKTGTYHSEARVAADSEGKTFKVELNGGNISVTIEIPRRDAKMGNSRIPN